MSSTSERILQVFFVFQLLLQFTSVLSARTDLGAFFIKNPESISVPIGDEVVFSCQTNIMGDLITWRFRPVGGRWQELPQGHHSGHQGNGLVQSSGPAQWVSNKPTKSELTVHLYNESLAGEYRCIASFGSSALMSLAAKLDVAKLENVPVLPDQKIIIAPGGTALIRCPPPISEPPATIMYLKLTEGRQVPVSSTDGIQGAGGALLVKPRSYSMYSCTAMNDMSQENKTYAHKIIVDVQDGPAQSPIFSGDMPSEVVGVEGSSINIVCGAIGRPAPKITWRRGTGRRSKLFDSPLLNITTLRKEDEDRYICEAKNSAGVQVKVVDLRVHSPPVIEQEDRDAQNDVWIKEGNSITVPCGKISGRPKPVVEWLINGVEVDTIPNIRVTNTHELEIDPVEKRHAGVVQCFASNSLGSATAFKVLIVVPKQLSGGGDMGLGEMERGGRPGNNRRHPRPRGHKNVMVPPSQPNVTRLSDQSVMVRWTVNNTGLPIRFFKVQHKDLTQNGPGSERGSKWETSNQEVAPHVRSFEVDGLKPDHYYKFRISAVYSNNDNKQGKNSGRFFLQRGIGHARAPPVPHIVNTEAISTSEIKLKWEFSTPSPEVKETPVEGFYVYYRPVSSADEYVKAAVEGGRSRQLIIKHLMPGSTYEIKLQSFTPAMASNFSAIVQEKTLKSPESEIAEEEEEDEIKDITQKKGVNGEEEGGVELYHIIGAGVGGVAVLSIVGLAGIIFYKKRKGGGSVSDKQVEGLGGGDMGNGYLPSPVNNSGHPVKNSTITITPNPLHTESENVDLEMSYISAQNNNCSTQSPRVSTEMSMIPSTCRDELRMQNHTAAIPTRENYV